MEIYKHKASNGTTYTLEMFINGNDIYGRNFDFSNPIRLYGKTYFFSKLKKQFADLVECFIKNPYEKGATEEKIKAEKSFDAIASEFVKWDSIK
jgi:hypothetical protein